MASNNKRKTSASQQRGTEKAREARRQAEAKKRKKNIIYGAIAAVLIIAIVILWLALPKPTDTTSTSGDSSTAGGEIDRDSIVISDHYEEGKQYYADIVIKDYGTITVELDANSAPISVENFVNLASSGFYDGLTFHRIIEGFMMQGGSSDGKGYAGSSETIYGEFASNGWDQNNISHQRGVISMARATDPNSASSQFFIMHEASTHLDGDYAAFGHVISGIEVVDEICESAEPVDFNGTIPASAQPVIETIRIYTAEDAVTAEDAE